MNDIPELKEYAKQLRQEAREQEKNRDKIEKLIDSEIMPLLSDHQKALIWNYVEKCEDIAGHDSYSAGIMRALKELGLQCTS